jgi:hypothetical protein
MIRVFCTCGRAFKTEDRHAGKETKCPECGADLTIGPVPNTSSSGSDTDEVPAWWNPNDPTAQAARGAAPPENGRVSNPDAVNTVVLPAGRDPITKPPAAAPTGPRAPALKAPVGAHLRVPARPSFPVGKDWAIYGGTTIALLVLAVGAIIWLRPAPQGANELSPATQATAPDKPGDLGPGNASAPSVPGHDAKSSENKIASTSTGAGSTGTLPSGPQADGTRQPKIAPANASGRLRLLVPTYIYPDDTGRKEWQRLYEAASKVEIIAIVNPSSGPGDERNLEYAAIFTEASKRGITLLGYVSTDYGKRPQPPIKNDIDTWIRFYPQIRGFFFDQQPRERQHAAQFTELRDYAKQKLRDALVITNPGVPCDDAYLAQAVSDVTCVFVNFQGFDRFELPATLQAYDPSRFAAMAYNISGAEAMRTAVKDTIIKRIGYIYISDAKPPNPWGKLPVYWETEVDVVSRLR